MLTECPEASLERIREDTCREVIKVMSAPLARDDPTPCVDMRAPERRRDVRTLLFSQAHWHRGALSSSFKEMLNFWDVDRKVVSKLGRKIHYAYAKRLKRMYDRRVEILVEKGWTNAQRAKAFRAGRLPAEPPAGARLRQGEVDRLTDAIVSFYPIMSDRERERCLYQEDRCLPVLPDGRTPRPIPLERVLDKKEENGQCPFVGMDPYLVLALKRVQAIPEDYRSEALESLLREADEDLYHASPSAIFQHVRALAANAQRVREVGAMPSKALLYAARGPPSARLLPRNFNPQARPPPSGNEAPDMRGYHMLNLCDGLAICSYVLAELDFKIGRVGYNDINPVARHIAEYSHSKVRAAHPSITAEWDPDVPSDMRDITRECLERLKRKGWDLGLVTMSFPCQGLSRAGKGRGLNDPRSGLYTVCKRIHKDIVELWPQAICFYENVAWGLEDRPDLSARASKNLQANWALLCKDLGEPLIIDNALLGASHRLRAFWVLQGHGELPGGARPLDIPTPDRVPNVKTWQECLDPGRRPPRALHSEPQQMVSRNTAGRPCEACWTLMKTINTYTEVPRKFRSVGDRTSSNRVFDRPYSNTGDNARDLEADRVGDLRMNARERERCCGLPGNQTAAPDATEADRAGGLGNSIMADTYKYILSFLPRQPPSETGLALRTRDPRSPPKSMNSWRAMEWTPPNLEPGTFAGSQSLSPTPPASAADMQPLSPTPPLPSSDAPVEVSLTEFERERLRLIARNREELQRLGLAQTAKVKKRRAKNKKNAKKPNTLLSAARTGGSRPADLADATAIVNLFRLASERTCPNPGGQRLRRLSLEEQVVSRGVSTVWLERDYLPKCRGDASPWTFYSAAMRAPEPVSDARESEGAETQGSQNSGSTGNRPGLRSGGDMAHEAMPDSTVGGWATWARALTEPDDAPPRKKRKVAHGTRALAASNARPPSPGGLDEQPPLDAPTAAVNRLRRNTAPTRKSLRIKKARAKRLADARTKGSLLPPEKKEGPLPRPRTKDKLTPGAGESRSPLLQNASV